MVAELTSAEWTAFHAAYRRSYTAACPRCGKLGETDLRPLQQTVRSFAGVAPIPASSGLTNKHRLNRGWRPSTEPSDAHDHADQDAS